MIKKFVLVVVMLSVATNLWAVKGPQDVSAGVHNLGSLGTYQGKATNEDEVCIFCHTPHGGDLTVPLWNRDLSYLNVGLGLGDGFTHYTSTTLSAFASDVSNATRIVNVESLLCMSCHDGTVAMNSIINNSNRTGAAPNDPPLMFDASFGFGTSPVIGDPDGTLDVPPITLGKNLTDDHPISFSYYSAWADPANTSKLRTPAQAVTSGMRFFGAGDVAGGRRVECSTCHDPHVNYTLTGNTAYTPFLITPNGGSALCLGCHLK